MPHCDRGGCYRQAEWQPVLVLNASRFTQVHVLGVAHVSPVAARAKLEQNICQHHRVALTVSDLVSPVGWQDLVRGFMHAGLPTPDRERLELEWERLPA